MTPKYRYNEQGQKIDEEGNVIVEHAYLESGGGMPLRFLRETTEPCPVCGRGPKPNKLAVLQEAPGQETVHCMACDYQTTRRPSPQSAKRLPLMNSRFQGQ